MRSVEKRFAPDYAAAQGHFPGNPIIPGAALLDEVMQAMEAEAGHSFAACEIRSAKFLHPVRPGDRVVIRWSPQESGELKFECLLEGRPAVTGVLRPGSAPA
jgi:3-hydroxyacyl-[acyl-carrier-protein] dehydratase